MGGSFARFIEVVLFTNPQPCPQRAIMHVTCTRAVEVKKKKHTRRFY